jgi:hypothetical protein
MGPRGLIVLILAGLVGISLAIVGWSQRHTGLVASGVGGLGGSAPAHSASASPARAGPTARAGTAPAATPSASGNAGPLLSSEPFAQFAYLVWPGTLSAAAQQAMSGLTILVSRQADGLSVRAGVTGQPLPSAQFYPNGARVYVIESSLGDDSTNIDYNLGDDGLVVTDAHGRIRQ